MLWKCYTQYVSKFGKLSSGHRTGKRSVFIPISKNDNAKECSNYVHLNWFHCLARVCSKSFKLDFSCLWTKAIRCAGWVLRRRGTRYQITNIHWITEKVKEFQKNIIFCFIDYAKSFDFVDHNKLWKILKEMGIEDHLTCLLRNLYAGQEATFRTRHGTMDWSKLGKQFIKAVYCHSAYLTYMQSTSCEMLGWMNHKVESRLPDEISTTSDMQITP